jgi:transcription elongation factor GreA
MPTIPITIRGAEKLKAELHRLKTVDRHSVIKSISEARAQGDLSENAEYEAAKDRQGFIEGRIQEIESKLAAAQVIDPTQLDAGGKIVFGATVELEEDGGERVKYQIVGEDEADLKPGDTAEVRAPGGVKHYEIMAVRYL